MHLLRRPLLRGLLASCLTVMVLAFALPRLVSTAQAASDATVTIDTAMRFQTIDGFGSCLAGAEAQQPWWQQLYYDDAQSSMLRVDLTPHFKAPYSDFAYNSPWFHNNPALPGPENNNVRTYTSPADYGRSFAGRNAQIAVMKADANANQAVFDFTDESPKTGVAAAKAGLSRKAQLGDFKLIGSIWSPPPWVKVSSGNTYSNSSGILPTNGTPWPFIWGGNFAGGKLDTSGKPLAVFNDGTQDTSALTQFARSMAAYVLGYQRAAGMRFYALSVQNELNFEEFYNSMSYPLSADYIIALKALRAEFDKYDELRDIKLMGPEDLMGGDAYGMWSYSEALHKNLRYLQNIEADPQAASALAFFNIHGYASNGVSSAGAAPQQWDWWANGWTTSPAGGIPANVKGFKAYGKKSWMTETSGEAATWLAPANAFPSNGGWSIALKMQQALTTGQQSAWVYWQTTDGNKVAASTLTDKDLLAASPKYVAFKHFARYIRPGAVRVAANVAGATTVSASAYVHDSNKTLTTVLVNSAATAQTVTLKLPAMPTGMNSLQSYTSSDGNLWQSANLNVAAGSITLTLPAYSVATLYGQAGGSNSTAVAATTPAGTGVAGTSVPTATLPPCPTAGTPAPTPNGSKPRAYLPLTRRGTAATCQ